MASPLVLYANEVAPTYLRSHDTSTIDDLEVMGTMHTVPPPLHGSVRALEAFPNLRRLVIHDLSFSTDCNAPSDTDFIKYLPPQLEELYIGTGGDAIFPNFLEALRAHTTAPDADLSSLRVLRFFNVHMESWTGLCEFPLIEFSVRPHPMDDTDAILAEVVRCMNIRVLHLHDVCMFDYRASALARAHRGTLKEFCAHDCVYTDPTARRILRTGFQPYARVCVSGMDEHSYIHHPPSILMRTENAKRPCTERSKRQFVALEDLLQ